MVPVLEAVNRRHNSSAILRSAECFGCHEVHMVTGRFKPAKGAARGSERWLELHRHQDLADCARALKQRGFSIYVADLSLDAMDPEQVPVDSPLAVVFGSELEGVSDEARSVADGLITVPMQGLTESLNVSVAAACILQRLTARRRAFLGGGDLELPRQLGPVRRSISPRASRSASTRRRGNPSRWCAPGTAITATTSTSFPTLRRERRRRSPVVQYRAPTARRTPP